MITEVCVMWLSLRLRQITQTSVLIIHDIDDLTLFVSQFNIQVYVIQHPSLQFNIQVFKFAQFNIQVYAIQHSTLENACFRYPTAIQSMTVSVGSYISSDIIIWYLTLQDREISECGVSELTNKLLTYDRVLGINRTTTAPFLRGKSYCLG